MARLADEFFLTAAFPQSPSRPLTAERSLCSRCAQIKRGGEKGRETRLLIFREFAVST